MGTGLRWRHDMPGGTGARAGRAGRGDAALGAEALGAATTLWFVVNAVAVLQAIGFATRPFAPAVNPALGLVIAALAVPATWALIRLVRVRAPWRLILGPVTFDAFVVLMLAVDYVARVEWRDPVVPAVQVPYLALFFGSIVLMGAPMARIDRRRWLVTVVTSLLLVAGMGYALASGVG